MRASSVPVVIPNWNGWEDTFAFLRSIVATSESVLLWLVDSASEADRTDEACDLCAGLHTVHWGQNYGWAGGYNRVLPVGMEDTHQFVCLLNNGSRAVPLLLESPIHAVPH